MTGGEWYELADFTGPRRRARLLFWARFADVAGFVLLAAVTVAAVLWWRTGAGWLVVPAAVCCGGPLAAFPFFAARAARRDAGRRVWVGGTRLLVDENGERREADLATAAATVELRGMYGRNARGYPVLIVRAEPVDLQLELGRGRPAELRPAQDLMLLSEALRANPDAAGQKAAGQLRTVAAWRTVPAIRYADPDAIPVTPLGAETPLPTPIRHGEPSPEVTLPPPRRRLFRRRKP